MKGREGLGEMGMGGLPRRGPSSGVLVEEDAN